MPPRPLPAYDKQVGHWRLSKDVLGSGTTFVVRATHVKLPALCAAVKIISRSGLLAKAGADPAALDLVDSVIHREVVLMKIAQHERVVRLYDFARIGDLAFILMEHAPHKTLLDLFRAAPSYLPRPLVAHIFSQLIHGLAYAHGLQIVHRDLKLENIFIFSPDITSLLYEAADSSPPYAVLNVKIGDFGLAHVDNPGRLSMVFHGSPHYQAPEVWLRVPHRPLPTDVWSAGVVLYALLCRRLPFGAATLENIVLPSDEDCQHDEGIGERYLLYDVPEHLHPTADSLLRRIFSYDPAARPTAQGMLWDVFFDGIHQPHGPDHVPVRSNASAHAMHPRVELYDIATLCVLPKRHVPRDRFTGSALEHAVRERVADPAGDTIEQQWVQRLSAHEASRDAWETSVDTQVAEFRRVRRAKSPGGRKTKAEEVLGPKMTSPAVARQLAGSFSFHSLRFRAAPLKESRPAVPHRSTLALESQRASSSLASALQNRREALLHRAYELGFGTGDLRAFADETNMIVRVAREGHWKMGLQEISREVERRAAAAHLGSHRGASACVSAATTLVVENTNVKHG